MSDNPMDARGLRAAREIEGQLKSLESFTPLALGVLSVASGIYTYLGVSSLLPETGALSFLAAIAYSLAVSVAIFVFWSYLIRLLPSLRTAASLASMFAAMALGALAILAMSSWLNAAALAGSAAVEQHLARTVQLYQAELEQANGVAVSAQSLSHPGSDQSCASHHIRRPIFALSRATVLAENPVASGPSSAFSAPSVSPVEMPLRQSLGCRFRS